MRESPVQLLAPPETADIGRDVDTLPIHQVAPGINDPQHLNTLTSLHDDPTDMPIFPMNIDSQGIPAELAEVSGRNQLSPEEAAELAWLSETHRIIILRLKELVIPVSGLVCFLLAIFFEAALIAVVWWVLYWHPVGGGGGDMGQINGSGTAMGGIIQNSDIDSNPYNPASGWHPRPLPTPPNLPDKPLWKPQSKTLALLDNTNSLPGSSPPVIGIHSNTNAWIAPNHPPESQVVHVKIRTQTVPQPHTPSRGPQPDTRGSQPDAPNRGSGGTGQFQMLKVGIHSALGSGNGGGSGRGRGPGVGGGPNIISWGPKLILPLQYRYAWPAHLVNPRFQLTIRPDGSVANVKVLRSSGHPSIDQAIITSLDQARCVPDIIGGKAVKTIIPVDFDLNSP